ncbi:MAG: hypothetical protein OXP75_18170 [Rhodospirillales bacterium]|nr:hypothetical protein [Rhodospirillales bacterium]
MAQARRARRAGRPSPDAILLEGSYSFEQKITVEWETSLEPDEFAWLLAPILAEPRSFAELRAYVSGALKERDRTLPPGKISKYLVSSRSLREALDAMTAAGRLTVAERQGSDDRLWSRRPC